MSKVFKVSRNFTIRGAKLIHADSAEQAIAIATAEDHPEFSRDAWDPTSVTMYGRTLEEFLLIMKILGLRRFRK